MTTPEVPDAVDRGYRRLQWLAGWARYLPQALWPTLAGMGAVSHPFGATAGDFARGCADGLNIAPPAARKLAQKHLRRHVLGYFRSLRYGVLEPNWWHDAVVVDTDRDVLEQLLHSGGLVLTCHVPEHHLLAVMFGQARQVAGIPGGVHPVVMSERQSPYFAVVGGYLKKLHNDTTLNLNGGRYVFLEPGISRREEVARLLASPAIVTVLNDNYNPVSPVQLKLFGRGFGVRSGAVRMALAAERPIYWAWWRASEHALAYRLSLERLQGETHDAILDDYAAKLDASIRAAPDLWDGWRWFPHSDASVD